MSGVHIISIVTHKPIAVRTHGLGDSQTAHLTEPNPASLTIATFFAQTFAMKSIPQTQATSYE